MHANFTIGVKCGCFVTNLLTSPLQGEGGGYAHWCNILCIQSNSRRQVRGMKPALASQHGPTGLSWRWDWCHRTWGVKCTIHLFLITPYVLFFFLILQNSPPHLVLPHGSYLMNLGSPVPETLEKSRNLLLEELQRCEWLQIPHFNFHPGQWNSSTVPCGYTICLCYFYLEKLKHVSVDWSWLNELHNAKVKKLSILYKNVYRN